MKTSPQISEPSHLLSPPKLLIRQETPTLVKYRGDTKPLKASEEVKTLRRMLKRFTTQTKFIYYRLLYQIPLLVKLSLPSALGVDDRGITTNTTYQNTAIISLPDLYQSQQVAVIFPDKKPSRKLFFLVSQLE